MTRSRVESLFGGYAGKILFRTEEIENDLRNTIQHMIDVRRTMTKGELLTTNELPVRFCPCDGCRDLTDVDTCGFYDISLHTIRVSACLVRLIFVGPATEKHVRIAYADQFDFSWAKCGLNDE